LFPIAEILTVALPVFAFLGLLLLLDSFKLVRSADLIIAIVLGMVSAGFSLLINTLLIEKFRISYDALSTGAGPMVEELVKLIFLSLLIIRRRVGFMIDGAIVGFSIGAGFAVIENLLFVIDGVSDNWAVLMVRGFGTAIMHGSVTAIGAIAIMSLVNKTERVRARYFVPGYIVAALIHLLYNQFFLSPLISSVLIILIMPGLIALVFYINEKSLSKWLEKEFDEEMQLLQDIRRGKFAESRAGRYFMKIKDRFAPEVVFDLFSYIQLSLELSIKAKTIVMLREAGLEEHKDEEIKTQLAELEELRRSIGKTGQIALSPILPADHKNLWKMKILD
jgi:RsiW-degrading membrane proteinase PrsW (M82 family)